MCLSISCATDNVEYDFGHIFTTEQLAAVTPDDITRYFKFQCHGNPEADTDVGRPINRVNSLKTWTYHSCVMEWILSW